MAQGNDQARALTKRKDVHLPPGLKDVVCKAIFSRRSRVTFCKHELCNRVVFVGSHPAAHFSPASG